jgi:diguanylate cyclase (GGDEF)-like protein
MFKGVVQRLLLTLLLVGTPALASASTVQGMPLLQRYTPDDYQAEAANLAVLAAPDGMVYVGNAGGLLRYDGIRWELLELPRLSSVRAMALGPDGRLFVGGYDQFGVVHQDATGVLHYEDLRPRFGLDPATATFGNVWTVVRAGGGVYFRTTDRLYFLGDDGAHRDWPTSEALRNVYVVGDELYARVHGQGMSRLVDDRFELIPGGERFAERPLYNLFPRDGGLLLVGDEGFELATAEGLRLLPGNAAEVFAQTQPYSGIELADGSYVFGTYAGELLHFSAALELIAQHPLGPFTVLELSADREGGVWAATEGDLVRLRLPGAWSQFGPADGLVGSVTDSAYHDGALWVATSQGVYRGTPQLGQMHFELAIETSLEANAVLGDRAGLLVGDREGVLLSPAGSGALRRIVTMDLSFDLRRSKFDPDLVIAFGESELVGLRRDGEGWREAQRWPLDGISVAELYEAGPFEWWLGDYRGGVSRWTLDPETSALVERRGFGAAEGLEVDPNYGTMMSELDGQLYAVSGQRVFRREGARFVAVDVAPFNQVDRPWDMAVVETDLGAFAVTRRELLRRAPGASEWRPVHFGTAVARGYSNVHVGDDGMLRLVTWNGLLQFDPAVAETELPPLAVGVGVIQRRLANGLAERLPLPANGGLIELPPLASVSLDFRLLSMEPGAEFRVRVEGLMDAWTEWGAATSPALTVRNPGPGTYVLHAEGRTRSGRMGTPLQLAIEAQPQWWQTRAAQVGAVLLLAVLVVAIAHWVSRRRYRQFAAINRHLEHKIAERTSELEAANRKLGELATEDSLTGVANRRALEQALLREWDRCRELGQPLSVIMVDVDHFKQFNDVHGHLAGDEQLIRVARTLSDHVRPVRELLARFGGEEFALVLPGASLDQAMLRAEAIRQAFDDGTQPASTISAGVASMVPNLTQRPDDLLRAADMALYAAKRAGRNRVLPANQGRVVGDLA